MKRKPLFHLFMTLLALVLAAAVFVSQTQAHASVARSDPADNAILNEAPEDVRIWFTEPVAVDFSTFRMLDINGQPVPLENIRRDEADHQLITLSLPELASGVYSIHWNVLSEADGHDTQGVLAFGIGSSADLNAAHTTVQDTAVPWSEVVLRWLNFSLLAAVTGGIAVRYLVLSKAEKDPAVGSAIKEAQRRIITGSIWLTSGIIIVGFLLLIYQIGTVLNTLPDNATFLSTGRKLITLTRWGYLWLGRQIIALLLLIFLGFLRGSRRRTEQIYLGFMAALAVIGLTVLQAMNSHAAAVATMQELAIAMDTLHLLGVGTWLGGLVVLIIGLLPIIRRERGQSLPLLRAGWGQFGLMAAISVIIIILTGIYNTGRQVATIDALISTFYGQTLLSKIGLMLLMGLIGLLNAMLLHAKVAAPLARRLKKPRGWTPLSPRRLPQLILAEMGVGILIILAAGVITASPNPQGPEFLPFDDSILLDSMTEAVDDMLISFSAKPNKPGQNVFLIRATSTRRPAPAEVMRVFARLTYLDVETGTTTVDAQEIDDGQYHIGGSYFSLAGTWQVEVAVRRRGVEDTVAQFEWLVPPAFKARPVIISNQPLEPLLTWTAVAGLVLALTFLILIGYRRRKAAAAPVLSVTEPVPQPNNNNSTGEGQAIANKTPVDLAE